MRKESVKDVATSIMTGMKKDQLFHGKFDEIRLFAGEKFQKAHGFTRLRRSRNILHFLDLEKLIVLREKYFLKKYLHLQVFLDVLQNSILQSVFGSRKYPDSP
jgi:hypothetical protein